jgi:hypothetical protein
VFGPFRGPLAFRFGVVEWRCVERAIAEGLSLFLLDRFGSSLFCKRGGGKAGASRIAQCLRQGLGFDVEWRDPSLGTFAYPGRVLGPQTRLLPDGGPAGEFPAVVMFLNGEGSGQHALKELLVESQNVPV